MAFQKASAEGGAKGGNRQDVMALDDVFLSIGESVCLSVCSSVFFVKCTFSMPTSYQ